MSLLEQRRERFEQAVIARMKEGGYLEVEIRVVCLARSGDGYYDGSVDAYWHFWNEALDGIAFVLPPTITASEVCDAFGMDDDAAGDCANMVNGAISSCGSLMKAAGLKVQP